MQLGLGLPCGSETRKLLYPWPTQSRSTCPAVTSRAAVRDLCREAASGLASCTHPEVRFSPCGTGRAR